MAKKIVEQNQNWMKSLSLLFVGLFLVIIIYGGLSINKLQKQNEALVLNQTKIQAKIISLQDDVSNQKNQIAVLSGDLEKNQNDLASYKKLTYSLQKKINESELAKAEAAKLTVVPAIATKTSTKKITKTVYVPEAAKHENSVTVQGVGSYKVTTESGDNAFTALQKATKVGGFPIEYQSYSFGVFVTSIGGQKAAGNQYWAFYYNGNYSQVGASDQKISDNDTTFWRLESF
jgi:hypothetical protein